MLKLVLPLLLLFNSTFIFSQAIEEMEEIQEFNLKINKTPQDAAVYLDGKEIETDEIKLKVNEPHLLKVIHPDYLSKQVEVNSVDGKDMKLDIELEPRSSSIEFDLNPPDTVIEINGSIHQLIDNKIHLPAGRYLFRYAAPQHYSEIEEIVIGNNKDYKREIHLTYNDPNLPPSSKKLTLRLDYNPYIYQSKEGWFSPIPLQVHAEYKYISMGMGFYWLTEKDEKFRQGQSTLFKREDHYDLWGELRFITPYFKKFKANTSLIYGNRISKYKSYSDSSTNEVIQSYSGYGLGLRYYFVSNFSIHLQLQQLGMKNRDDQKIRHEFRTVMGFSFEFN